MNKKDYEAIKAILLEARVRVDHHPSELSAGLGNAILNFVERRVDEYAKSRRRLVPVR